MNPMTCGCADPRPAAPAGGAVPPHAAIGRNTPPPERCKCPDRAPPTEPHAGDLGEASAAAKRHGGEAGVQRPTPEGADRPGVVTARADPPLPGAPRSRDVPRPNVGDAHVPLGPPVHPALGPGPTRAGCSCSTCADASETAPRPDPHPCPCPGEAPPGPLALPGIGQARTCGCAEAPAAVVLPAGAVAPPSGAVRPLPADRSIPRLPRMPVELPTECVERCAALQGERRPRYSYIDVCLLPWSPPTPGTYMRVAEPPQGALPPWGPIEEGPERPHAADLCTSRPREMEHDEEPDGLGASESCPARPAWRVPWAPRPVCLAHPQPLIYASPLAVAVPEFRGKPSSEVNLCNCQCSCKKEPVITGKPGLQDDGLAGAGAFAHALAPAQRVVHAGRPPPRGLVRGAAGTLEPPQVFAEALAGPPGACVQRHSVYAAPVGLIDHDRIGSCAEDRILVPPAHPKLSDGDVAEALTPSASASTAMPHTARDVVRASSRGRVSAAGIVTTPGMPAPSWSVDSVPGPDEEDEPLPPGAQPEAATRDHERATVPNAGSEYPLGMPGRRGPA